MSFIEIHHLSYQISGKTLYTNLDLKIEKNEIFKLPNELEQQVYSFNNKKN